MAHQRCTLLERLEDDEEEGGEADAGEQDQEGGEQDQEGGEQEEEEEVEVLVVEEEEPGEEQEEIREDAYCIPCSDV